MRTSLRQSLSVGAALCLWPACAAAVQLDLGDARKRTGQIVRIGGAQDESGPTEPPADTPAGPTSTSVTLERRIAEPPDERREGKTVTYVIRLSWEGDIEVSAPEAPSLTGLEWVNSRTRDSIDGGRVEREYLFELRAVTEGPVSIGRTRIYYSAEKDGRQRAIDVKGMDFDVLAAPRDYTALLAGAGIGVAVLGAAGLVLFLVARRMGRPAGEAAPPEPTPVERLRAAAVELDAMMIEGDAREVFARLARGIREFLSIVETPDLSRKSTAEIVDYLSSQEPPRTDRGRIVDTLEKCDAVAYAGHAPSRDECEAALRDWKSILAEAPGNDSKGQEKEG